LLRQAELVAALIIKRAFPLSFSFSLPLFLPHQRSGMLQVGLKLEKFPERRDVTPPEISTRILDAESDSTSVMPRQRVSS